MPQTAVVPVQTTRATALALKVVMMMTCLGAISEHSITPSDLERSISLINCVVYSYVWPSSCWSHDLKRAQVATCSIMHIAHSRDSNWSSAHEHMLPHLDINEIGCSLLDACAI